MAKKPINFKWEKFDENTERAKVLGGWIVYASWGYSGGMTFIPDPKHEWIPTQDEVKENAR